MAETQPNQTNKVFDPQRITLRPITLSDVDDFMIWVTDEKVSKFCTWEPYTCKNDAVAYIQNVLLVHPWYRLICLDGRPVGGITVTENKGNDRCRGELGYVLGSEYWGRGIVTEAVKMAAMNVFRDWPHLERIEALVDIDNLGSQRVLEKVGFEKEGVLRKYVMLKGRVRDMVIFSLLSTEIHLLMSIR